MIIDDLKAQKQSKREFIQIFSIIEESLLYGYVQNSSDYDKLSKAKGERVRLYEKYLKQVTKFFNSFKVFIDAIEKLAICGAWRLLSQLYQETN